MDSVSAIMPFYTGHIPATKPHACWVSFYGPNDTPSYTYASEEAATVYEWICRCIEYAPQILHNDDDHVFTISIQSGSWLMRRQYRVSDLRRFVLINVDDACGIGTVATFTDDRANWETRKKFSNQPIKMVDGGATMGFSTEDNDDEYYAFSILNEKIPRLSINDWVRLFVQEFQRT